MIRNLNATDFRFGNCACLIAVLAAVGLAGHARLASGTEFSAGDLLVTRIGSADGPTLAAGQTAAAYLTEVTTSGDVVQSLPLPTAADGSNNPLTIGATAASEGELSLSGNGQVLVLAGYDIAPGGAPQGESTVALIDSSGNIDTSTTTSLLTGNNTRGAMSIDGSSIWVTGPKGLVYETTGSSSGTNVDSSGNFRALEYVSSTLYPAGDGALLASSNKSPQGVDSFTPAIPVDAGATPSVLSGMTSKKAPDTYAFFFANPTTLFVADADDGIQEWTETGGTWSSTTTLAGNYVGLTGTQTGNTVTLYATTGTSTSAGWAPDNSLVRVTFSFNSNDSGPGSFAAPVTLATATGNSAFSGVAFAPGAGGAIVDNSGSYSFNGNVLTVSYPVGDSYAGISTQITSQTSSTTTGGSIENSTATILAGTNSGSFTEGETAPVSMTWRNRTLAETPAGNMPLISDVVNLYGMASGATGSPTEGAVQTDPFVLQLTFDPSSLGSEETQSIAAGKVYLAWLNPNGGGTGLAQWQHANTGDVGGAATTAASAPTYIGSFVDYLNSLEGDPDYPLLENDDFGSPWTSATIGALSNDQLDEILGSWGVDATDQDAWAVVNHNSQFAVVPEPATLLLAVLSLVVLGFWKLQLF